MEADKLKELFDSAQSNSEKLQFTAEESEKFRKAFDEPEFRKLFAEYMDELQDPKHREENEAYISQLETEKKVPEGKELIRPDPGFVAKTSKTAKESQNSEKLFLNIVQSTKINAPTKTSTPKGDCWSVPYSLGPPHMEKDKEGNNAPCFDCCFNPEALRLSKQHKEFRELLVHTAMEGVEQMYKTQHQEVTLKRDFHVVKGIDYKSGQVPTMMIPIASKAKWDSSKNPLPEPPAAATASGKSTSAPAAPVSNTKPAEVVTPPTPPAVPAPAVERKKSTPAIKKGFLNNAKTTIYPESVTVKKMAVNSSSTGGIKLTADNDEDASGAMSGLSLSDKQQQPRKSLIQEIKPGSESSAKTVEPSVIKTKAAPTGASSSSDTFLKPVSTTLKNTSSSTTSTVAASSTASPVKSTASDASPAPSAAPVTPTTSAHPSTAATTTSSAADSPVVAGSSNTSGSTTSSATSISTPNYTVKERGNISMGDFEAMKDSVASNRPSELVYRIELPLVTKAAQVVLDVAERHLSLSYLDVYKLSVDLPYPVFDSKGSAKYDKTAKCLNVTLPVKPAPRTALSKPVATSAAEDNESGDASAHPAAVEVSPVKKAGAPVAVSHSRWVSGTSGDAQSGSNAASSGDASTADSVDDWKKEIALKAQQALEEAKKAAAAGAAAVPSSTSSPTSATSTATAVPSAASVVSDVSVSGDFTAAAAFSGARPGYVFRNGDLGVGYYRDNRSKTSPAAVSSTTGTTATAAVSVSGGDSQKYASFTVDCKQTDANVALLVQVPHILSSSVCLQFHSHSVHVSFTGGSENSNGGVTSTQYGAVLSFDAAACPGGINASKSRYDVASKNMVVVLVKARPGLWAPAQKDQQLFKMLPYATSGENKENGTKTSSSVASSAGGPSRTEKDLKSAVDSMQFSSSSVLYDLD